MMARDKDDDQSTPVVGGFAGPRVGVQFHEAAAY